MKTTKTTVTAIHGLTLIPLDSVYSFVAFANKVRFLSRRSIRIEEIPGSLKKNSNLEEGTYKNKFTFERRLVDEFDLQLFENFRRMRFIATYHDDRDVVRVAGSPQYPLTLTYTAGNGVCSVAVEGSDTMPDAFMGL